jgi:hypothetical protein
MKKILLLILILLPLFLLSDELDLGKIIIEGKSEIAVDSLASLQRFREFNLVSQKERLAFRAPYFEQSFLRPTSSSTGERGYLAGRWGEVLAADLRAKILLPQSKWLGFLLTADFWEYEQKWNFRNTRFGWSPALKENYFQANLERSELQWDDGFLANDLTWGNFGFRSHNLLLFSDYKLDYLELKGEIGAYNYQLDHPANVETSEARSDYYEEFTLAAASQISAYHIRTKYAYLRSGQLAEFYLGQKNFMIAGFSIFDEIALNLWYEKTDAAAYFIPMLSWQRRLDLLPKLDLILANQPKIDASFFSRQYARDLYIKEFPAAKRSPKEIINLSTALQYNSFLPLTFALNYKQYQDFRYLQEADLAVEFASQDLNEISLSAQLAYQYKFFHFLQEFVHYLGEKRDIHLQPKWLAKSQFIFATNKWRVSLDFCYEERKIHSDLTELLSQNLWLISLSESYDIRENLQIEAELNNILDIDNRRFSFEPDSAGGFQFKLGMKYSF